MISKVSIIIPMYNEERYISRCLSSIKNQSFKDFEIILIDDGSSDGTIIVAEKFKNDLELTILNQEHGGPGKARNWGANHAKGEILIFVDADMFFDKKFIEELIRPIIDGSEIGTSHGVELVGNLENPIARAWSINRIPNPPIRTGVYRAILKNIFLDSGGFDSSKGYFDDDLSKINNGIGALTIMSAICYHNNPETIKEGYKHSIWVGKGLAQSGHLYDYLKIYKKWLISFVIFGLFISLYFVIFGLIIIIPLILLVLIGIFIGIKTIQRFKKEKYLSHLFFVPLVLIVRGVGYGVGIINYFLKR